ncbi:MAG: sigma-54-dependent Fis family transcriptional regulator [Candidatus Eisenbacteria bacterium]|nr:sigma-54-dependent Fis family transcriptional regulator [Candidatus Eisenbacteria bacterium]
MEARSILTRALHDSRTKRLSRHTCGTYEYLGELRLAEGNFHRARRLLSRAHRIGVASGDPEAQFEPQYRLAEAELGLGNAPLARKLAVEARDDFAGRGNRLEAAFAARVAAQALLCQGSWAEALEELEAIHATLEEFGEQFEIHRVARLIEAAHNQTPIRDIRAHERDERGRQDATTQSDGPAQTQALATSVSDASGINDSAVTAATTSSLDSPSFASPGSQPDLVAGRSPHFLAFLKTVDAAANSNAPILLLGETGVGKELVARRIHMRSARAAAEFVPFNCGTSSGELFDSELFGYVRGAYTGATGSRKGLSRTAHGGTLLLDEVGELSTDFQTRLLRMLENGEVRPVGSDRIENVDIRIIAATNRNIDQLVQDGQFRQDLLFRLDIIRLEVPALREHAEDIELLVPYFIDLARRNGLGSVKGISKQALRRLMNHDWPGNVRELRNEVFRLVTMNQGRFISSWEPRSKTVNVATMSSVPELVRDSLKQTSGSVTAAAQLLGIHRSALYRLTEKLGIDLSDFRG